MKTASSSCPMQASIIMGDMERTQLQLYSCLLTKSKEALRIKNNHKKEKKKSQKQSSCPFYNHNLLSQNN